MDESQIFIVGANGQLGTELRARYPNAKSADIDALDITNRDSVLGYDWSNIQLIINAAAYTNVDGAETPEGRVPAWQVNAQAVAYLAEVARKNDITLVHISTDYVFDGSRDNHKEDESFSPLSVYGATKAAADIIVGSLPKHYILRTSWVIGQGHNFVRTMLDLGQRGVSPSVVNDQIGRLTFTSQLVAGIDHLLKNNCAFGTYNLTNDGTPASWADIARQIYDSADFGLEVKGVSTAEYYAGKDNIAARPAKSSLDLTKIKSVGLIPADYHEALIKYVKKEMQKQ